MWAQARKAINFQIRFQLLSGARQQEVDSDIGEESEVIEDEEMALEEEN